MDKTLNLDEILKMVWCGALDTSTSKDFRDKDGVLKEEAYIKAEEGVIKWSRSQLQELVKEAIPKRRKFTPEEELTEIRLDPEGYQRRQGYNQAIEDITKALREKGLL